MILSLEEGSKSRKNNIPREVWLYLSGTILNSKKWRKTQSMTRTYFTYTNVYKYMMLLLLCRHWYVVRIGYGKSWPLRRKTHATCHMPTCHMLHSLTSYYFREPFPSIGLPYGHSYRRLSPVIFSWWFSSFFLLRKTKDACTWYSLIRYPGPRQVQYLPVIHDISYFDYLPVITLISGDENVPSPGFHTDALCCTVANFSYQYSHTLGIVRMIVKSGISMRGKPCFWLFRSHCLSFSLRLLRHRSMF